jgi:hypothetical protein
VTAVAPEAPISARRKWAAVGIASLLLAASFWAVQYFMYSWLGDRTAEELEAGLPGITSAEAAFLAGGLVVLAAAFAALAAVSRRPRPGRAAAVATFMGLGAIVLLTFLMALVGQLESYTPMVGGFCAGGLVALRADVERVMSRRVLAAVLVTGYFFLLLRFYPPAGVILAPLLPLPALVWADTISARRAAAEVGG